MRKSQEAQGDKATTNIIIIKFLTAEITRGSRGVGNADILESGRN
jgi:hypothetical protein